MRANREAMNGSMAAAATAETGGVANGEARLLLLLLAAATAAAAAAAAAPLYSIRLLTLNGSERADVGFSYKSKKQKN